MTPSKCRLMQQAAYSNLALLYDSLMADVDYAGWASYLTGLLSRWPASGRRVLDLGCGTGTMSIQLAKAGYQVTGVDISPEMLAIAADKGLGAGIPVTRWRQMDMRDLQFTDSSFDIAVCACDGFNYLASLEDLQQALHSIHRVLAPQGVLLFDVHSEYKMRQIFADGLFVQESDAGCCIWQSDYDVDTEVCEHYLTIFLREQDGRYRRTEEEHIQRFFPVPAIKAVCKQAGFREIHVLPWGEEGGALVSDHERLQFVVRK